MVRSARTFFICPDFADMDLGGALSSNGGMRFRILSFLIIALAALSAGCATSARHETTNEIVAANDIALHQLEDEILSETAELGSTEGTKARIPLEINENVKKWIDFFTVKDRVRFHGFLKRGNVYRELVQDILKKNGVPSDLYYLAMIESGYVMHATSPARAAGAWQFMPATGKRYGLRQNRYVDERRDIARSTDAAAKYLKNLNFAFQSWYLAMAGYNAGEGRILGALLKGQSRDFWKLVENKSLPPETRNYVPKFLAAAIIGRNPAKYGFTDTEAPALARLEAVAIPGGVQLAEVARATGISHAELAMFNPQLLRGMTPPTSEHYALWVPREKAGLVAAAHFTRVKIHEEVPGPVSRIIARARAGKIMAGKLLAKRSVPIVHRVRKGEALSHIARHYNITVSRLKRHNDLHSSRIYYGQKLVIPNAI